MRANPFFGLVMAPPFYLHLPKSAIRPIVASLPHSGLAVPEAIAQTLDVRYQNHLPNQDWHLNKLYDFLPSLGITTLEAIYSRYVVDLNRSAKEPLFGSFWKSVVSEKTAFDQPLYRTPPSQDEIERRVEQFYQPYHQQLKELLNQLINQFGQVYLFDLHSFLGLISDEVCLGNVNGRSCSDFWLSMVETEFSTKGYQVVRNKVFSGGYITQHYGQIEQVEALQIEIRYPTYLDTQQLDQDFTPSWDVPVFYEAKRNLKAIFSKIADQCTAQLPAR